MQERSRVIFDDDGSFIEHNVSGKKTYLKEKNGVCVLDAWIMPKDKEPVFARQG